MLSSRLLLQLREVARDPSGAMSGTITSPFTARRVILPWQSKLSSLRFDIPTPKTSEEAADASGWEQRDSLLGTTSGDALEPPVKRREQINV